MKFITSALAAKIVETGEGVIRYNLESKIKTLQPRSVMVNLTYKCNSRCIMCNIWQIRPKHELTFNDWKRIIKDPIFSDIRNLTVSGGEPALYPDFVRAVKLFVNSMPKLRRLVINTNGFMPEVFLKQAESIATFTRRKGVKLSISVSIDGVGKMHEKIRRIENGFDKSFRTLTGLKKLSKKYGFGVGVSSVLMRTNINEFEKMLDWFKDTGTEGNFQIVGFHETFLKNAETEKDIGIDRRTQEKFVEALKKMKAAKRSWSLGRYYWEDMVRMYTFGGKRTTPCPFLKDDFVIDSFGDVYYCLSTRAIGNLVREKRGVGEIYFDKKNLLWRKNLPKSACQNCNSGCNTTQALAFDFKRYFFYLLTGKLWPVKVLDVG